MQFNNAVTSGGSPLWRIGSTSAANYTLENCNSCGVSGWGWQDDAYGLNVPPTLIYFATSGPQNDTRSAA